MTLQGPPLLVDGGEHSGETFRLFTRGLTRANEGIVEGDDLKVRALDVPAGAVLVGDGSGFIIGRANTWQGTYHLPNVGDEQVDIAPTGANPRSDLVVLRVEDPNFEGDLDPADAGHFDVVSNVAAGTTTVPAGMSAIPLARIDIPAHTGAITNAMIVDVRAIANPRRTRDMWVFNFAAVDDTAAAVNAWEDWPDGASGQVKIPAWAGFVIITATINGVQVRDGNVNGNLRWVIGAVAGPSMPFDENVPADPYRTMYQVGAKTVIPAAARGTSQLLKLQAERTLVTGKLRVDVSSSVTYDFEFLELPT